MIKDENHYIVNDVFLCQFQHGICKIHIIKNQEENI